MKPENEKLVFRSIAFPLSAFDYLKDFQRAYEGRHGVRITNNEAVAIIFGEHKQATAGSGAHEHKEADARR